MFARVKHSILLWNCCIEDLYIWTEDYNYLMWVLTTIKDLWPYSRHFVFNVTDE